MWRYCHDEHYGKKNKLLVCSKRFFLHLNHSGQGIEPCEVWEPQHVWVCWTFRHNEANPRLYRWFEIKNKRWVKVPKTGSFLLEYQSSALLVVLQSSIPIGAYENGAKSKECFFSPNRFQLSSHYRSWKHFWEISYF